MTPEVKKLAEQIQKDWFDLHKNDDAPVPVWAYFRDRAERILEGREVYTPPYKTVSRVTN